MIYLITGAGGQHLYNPEQSDDPASWQLFTDKFASKVHSMTVVDVQGKTLTVRQTSAEGEELDRFVMRQVVARNSRIAARSPRIAPTGDGPPQEPLGRSGFGCLRL